MGLCFIKLGVFPKNVTDSILKFVKIYVLFSFFIS